MSCGGYPVSRDSPPIISLTMEAVGQAKYVVQNVVFSAMIDMYEYLHAFGGACHIGCADMQAAQSFRRTWVHSQRWNKYRLGDAHSIGSD